MEKIYVAGHNGMVGSAIVRALKRRGHEQIVGRRSHELDLTRQADVEQFLRTERPDTVILAAARVGGILANSTYRAEFIRTNLLIQANVIDAAWRAGVEHLLFFSSSCVYPRLCPQPMKEEHLWTGPLEPTNEPYAVAKLAGMSMCHAYRQQYGAHFVSVIPANVFGPNDNFDPADSHFAAAFIRNFHTAKIAGSPTVTLWGTGTPRRELMYVDDAAEAALTVLETSTNEDCFNIGTGEDHTIRELAERVKRIVGYEGELSFDTARPDGMPRKLLDPSRLLALGWRPTVELDRAIELTYEDFLRTVWQGV